MTIENNIIATSISELKGIVTNALLSGYESGKLNLTIHDNGDVEYWRPSTQGVTESVVSIKDNTPKHISLQHFPSSDEYHETQPSDVV